MAETGSRDDLVVDVSRCLKMRYSESSCRRCADICPHGAISLDGALAVDQNHCSGCLLCASVCQSGALEQNNDFTACSAKLARVPSPVLGCFHTKERSNATVACLGGLSEEHLVTLCHSLSGKLILNMTACSECPNRAMVSILSQRIGMLLEEGLLSGSCSIVMAESAHDVSYRDESVDRRSFFKSFGRSLFKSAEVILSSSNEPVERRAEYAGKRLPVRRALLNGTRDKLSHESETQMQKRFDSCISFSEACTMCQGCVAICPTGALKTEEPGLLPMFDNGLCSGCGLCQEFCLDQALKISPMSD